MASPATKALLDQAFSGYTARLQQLIAANGGAVAPGSFSVGDETINRQAPVREYVGSILSNKTITLGTGYAEEEAIFMHVYVDTGATLTIASSQPIAVMGGTTETSHQLQGKVTKSLLLKKTSTGWELYI